MKAEERDRVVEAVKDATRREWEKCTQQKGLLEEEAALEVLERLWAGAIPVHVPDA